MTGNNFYSLCCKYLLYLSPTVQARILNVGAEGEVGYGTKEGAKIRLREPHKAAKLGQGPIIPRF